MWCECERSSYEGIAEKVPQLSWSKWAGLTIDGAPAMMGKQNGSVALIKKHVQNENADQDFQQFTVLLIVNLCVAQ